MERRRATGVGISVKVSAAPAEPRRLLTDVRRALQQSGIEPSLLTLEIAETTVMRDVAAAAERLQEIKQLGVRIAIDDFGGSGYAYHSDLQRLPLDFLKVDRSSLAASDDEDYRSWLLEAILVVGRDLSLTVIAKGIETARADGALQAMGCTMAQGLFMGAPTPADAVESLLDADLAPRRRLRQPDALTAAGPACTARHRGRPSPVTPQRPDAQPRTQGSVILPRFTGSCSSMSFEHRKRRQPARGHRAARSEGRDGVQRRGHPQRAVEGRGDIGLRARGAHERRRRQQARDPAAAADLQAHRVGHARAQRAVLGRGLVDRDPRAHALAHLPDRVQPVGRLLHQLEPGRRQRLDRPHRLLDRPRAVRVQAQRDLRARRRAHRRHPRRVVPDPHLQLDALIPRSAAACACSAAPPRSVAPIVAFTLTSRAAHR